MKKTTGIDNFSKTIIGMSVATRIFSWFRSIFRKIKCYCLCQENVTDEVLEKYDNKSMKTFIFDKHTVQKKKEFKVSIK